MGGSSLPALVSPSFSDESPDDDSHLGEGDPEVDYSAPALGTRHATARFLNLGIIWQFEDMQRNDDDHGATL